ncbi:glycoside hydrolase family 79 protein [Thelephora ganbajun]|uniref:Glycoside hydrolase family 79 protein n=1 Tax=Thelephora ganbajun TaxID=370292 RepID=A0ACB6Z5V8_THEGA|nr:glycoside hydrolase family 79 protein [Thelephora ganbajun]
MLPLGLYSLFTLLLWEFKPVFGTIINTRANIPTSPPSNSEKLAPTLLSFSLEQDRWPDWAGRHSQNVYTYNALTNYAQLTGQPPKIRVGANTEDRTLWGPNVDLVSTVFPAPNETTPYPEATSMNVGDEYYRLSRFMPRGTHMTWGLNLGYSNVTNAVNMAQSIFRAFSSASETTRNGVVLDLIELGNESDLYRGKVRPSNWTISQFVQNWIENMTPVARVVKLSVGGPVGVIACSFVTRIFTATGSFNAGILDSEPGKYITHISQHWYSGEFCNGGDFHLRSFMSKSAVRGNLTVFNPDITATRSRGLVYVMGETNSIGCHGAPGVSNTAGAALWAIDYTLQAATLGIQEIYYHGGIGFKYNFFQPIALDRSPVNNSHLSPPSQPYLQPPYYAGLVVNTAVGRMAGSGMTKIVELELTAPNLSGYAIYEMGKPARAVFVNLNAWLKSDARVRERSVYHIDLSFVSTAKEIKIKRLDIGYADDTSSLMWGGQSWETREFLVSGREVTETRSRDEGVDIRETEAILIWF